MATTAFIIGVEETVIAADNAATQAREALGIECYANGVVDVAGAAFGRLSAANRDCWGTLHVNVCSAIRSLTMLRDELKRTLDATAAL